MAKVFISYRRDDAEDIAGRIYDRLRAHYGRANVIFDVDDVPIGVNFRDYLHGQVVQCDALLAIIGRSWLAVTDDAGKRRLDNPRDYLRIEIESAVRERKPVVPVLVRRARMPEEDDLPESLAFLAYINAATVSSGKDFETHSERLIRGLDRLLQKPPPVVASPTPRTPKKKPPRKGKAPAPRAAARSADRESETQEMGPWLLEQLKIAATELLPNTSWKSNQGWWSLGSKRGLHLLRAKATRNTMRIRIRKNQSRRTGTRSNATGWIYESKSSIVREQQQLGRALELFKKEWL